MQSVASYSPISSYSSGAAPSLASAIDGWMERTSQGAPPPPTVEMFCSTPGLPSRLLYGSAYPPAAMKPCLSVLVLVLFLVLFSPSVSVSACSTALHYTGMSACPKPS